MKNLVAISAGLSTPSSSRLLTDKLVEATRVELEACGETVALRSFELRDYAHDVTNALLNGYPSENLSILLKVLAESDGAIFVTPIFTTSYSGLFKSFVDILEVDLLEGKPILLGATGGTARHSLAIDYALRPLFTYLHAEPVSSGVFAASSDWGGEADTVAPLGKRVARGSRELAKAMMNSEPVAKLDPYDPASYLGDGGLEAMLNALP
jgi:FMN reductase